MINWVENRIRMCHDSYKLLTPSYLSFEFTPIMCNKVNTFLHIKSYMGDMIEYRELEVKHAYNLCHMTFGKNTMKFLKFFEDDKAHHYNDILLTLFPDKNRGHDIDCYKLLISRGMITFSHKGKRGLKFYKITPFGHEVLNICKANDVYYKPMRWFCMDEDEMFANLLKADMGDDDSATDISTESLLTLMKDMLSTTSPIAKIRSRYRWFNKFMQKIMTSRNFYEAVNVPEINEWLDAHKNDSEVSPFYNRYKKIQKTWAKKLAS